MNAEQRAANAALLKRLGVVVVGMFGFGFALVPFYEKICEVTGIRNIDGPARGPAVNTQVDASRTVREVSTCVLPTTSALATLRMPVTSQIFS